VAKSWPGVPNVVAYCGIYVQEDGADTASIPVARIRMDGQEDIDGTAFGNLDSQVPAGLNSLAVVIGQLAQVRARPMITARLRAQKYIGFCCQRRRKSRLGEEKHCGRVKDTWGGKVLDLSR
jgi:hypothetical protein